MILDYVMYVSISKHTRNGYVLLYCNDCVVDSDVSYNVELDNANGNILYGGMVWSQIFREILGL